MKKIIQYFVVPMFIAIITATSALFGLWAGLSTPKDLIDFLTSLPVVSLLGLCTLAIVQAFLNVQEKIKDARKVSYVFRLRREAEPELDVENKYKNDGTINGLLTIRVDKGKKKDQLLQRQVCYDEILNGPSEVIYQEDTESKYSSIKQFKNATFRLFFQPNQSSFWTRNVYDKDSLKENLFDAPLTSNGERQVLVYSSTLKSRVSEWLSCFPEPENVLKVERKGYKANNEEALPIILNLIKHISFSVNREKLLEFSLTDVNLCHHFAIGATTGRNGIKKFSLFYAVEATIAINNKGELKVIDWHPSPEALEEFNKSLLKSLTDDSYSISKAFEKLDAERPKGLDI